MQPRQAVQDVDLDLGQLGAFCLLDEQGHHLIPLLGLLQDALLRLERALVARCDLPHAAPHGQGALEIAKLGFRQHGDLLQARQ